MYRIKRTFVVGHTIMHVAVISTQDSIPHMHTLKKREFLHQVVMCIPNYSQGTLVSNFYDFCLLVTGVMGRVFKPAAMSVQSVIS